MRILIRTITRIRRTIVTITRRIGIIITIIGEETEE